MAGAAGEAHGMAPLAGMPPARWNGAPGGFVRGRSRPALDVARPTFSLTPAGGVHSMVS